MTIQHIVYSDCIGNLNKFGKLIALNALGYRMEFYGFVRQVKEDHIVFEHEDAPGKFKIRTVLSFTPMRQRRKVIAESYTKRVN